MDKITGYKKLSQIYYQYYYPRLTEDRLRLRKGNTLSTFQSYQVKELAFKSSSFYYQSLISSLLPTASLSHSVSDYIILLPH